MAKTLIRHATNSDFPTLLSIDEASFPDGVAYDSEELSFFMNRAGTETLVLEVDGRIAAFLILEVNRRRKLATLVTLDVRSEHRRQGYGARLLKRSEEILETYDVETYNLQVDVGNAPAIAFYDKHGFKMSKTLKSYYANGNDAYQMVKRLQPADDT
jgi:ribosomal-protein-alanine N-acetyltransferase